LRRTFEQAARNHLAVLGSCGLFEQKSVKTVLQRRTRQLDLS
jgi:hypothetical protein